MRYLESGLSLSTAALAILILAVAHPARADIAIEERYVGSLRIEVSGEIGKADADALAGAEAKLRFSHTIAFWLDSPGGDVSAAMFIGRIVRKHEARTFLAMRSKCLSSCALIFIAGVERLGVGSLGLHRPYFDTPARSREAVQQATSAMQKMVQGYIAEMGVSPTFYDIMMRTDPSQMRTIEGQRIAELVPGRDPVWDEIKVSYDARYLGVSTAEVRRRSAEQEKCVARKDWPNSDCFEATWWGLSEGVYKRRRIKPIDCFVREEVRELYRLPALDRRDHEFTIRSETCERQKMATD